MNAAQVLTYQADESVFRKVIDDALSYALLSFPYTVNRMRLGNLHQRITNIAKGKIAEGLLQSFAEERKLDMDFNAGATPFYKPDHFDFSFKGMAWDVKNNFIYHQGTCLSNDAYLKLPALVPNRFDGDQWSKRSDNPLPGVPEAPLEKAFLFTFIKQADERKSAPFLMIHYTQSILKALESVANSVAGNKPETEPYTPEHYFEKLRKVGGIPGYTIHNIPALILTGAATSNQWKLFADTDGISEHGYHHYTGRWYDAREDGGLVFCGGLLHTRIKNATCPVGFLPAFADWLG
jgi:hypothetical protein